MEVQENPTDKLIRELKAENAKLKKMLGALQALRGGRGVRVEYSRVEWSGVDAAALLQGDTCYTCYTCTCACTTTHNAALL